MSTSNDSIDLPGGLEETWFQRTRFGKFLARPCVGNSFVYGTGGYFAAFLASFGWTSSLRRANIHAIAGFAIVTALSSTVCTIQKIVRDGELKTQQGQRQDEKSKRDEALRKKIEDRKRKHAERKRLEEEKAGKVEEA